MKMFEWELRGIYELLYYTPLHETKRIVGYTKRWTDYNTMSTTYYGFIGSPYSTPHSRQIVTGRRETCEEKVKEVCEKKEAENLVGRFDATIKFR